MTINATVGSADANSYGTLAEANAYFAVRQSANWDGSDAHKEMALIKAAQFLDNVYRGRWLGQKATQIQALAWPRGWVVDVDGYGLSAETIPKEVKYAQFEAAYLIANGTPLETTIDRAIKSEQIGPMAVTYMDGATLQAQYPQVTNWLNGLVKGGSSVNGSFGNARVTRS